MNLEERLSALAARLRVELSEEFPMWRITRDERRWIAEHPAEGVVYAATSHELRERLRAHRRPRERGEARED
jgi:hypothetical protein